MTTIICMKHNANSQKKKDIKMISDVDMSN